ncbi:hypothetical protein OEZ86_010653 [Tetradesmus obliquus]|nr:hypothetical protein OEZ86_010653 [Tetradesmus obliquus]
MLTAYTLTEGQARLIDFIKSAAAEREAAPAGVWASFGKPYACLGELQQLDSSAASLLPHLNRDYLHSSQQQRRPGARSSSQGAAATARGSTAEAAAAAAGVGGSSAAGISSKEQEAAKLLHHKTVMKFSTVDRTTVGGSGTARLSVAATHRMSVTSDAVGVAAPPPAAAGGEACGPWPGSSSPPDFKTVTELTLQQPGSSNPVTSWHNDFVKVRHAGYTALQSTLWQRSQARAVARGAAEGRAQLSSGLMDSLDAVRGRLAPGWIPGTTPDNPYTISKQHAAAAAAAAEGPAAAGTRNIKATEVELLEHFYDALCGLVERQRLSDPLSLYVVHQVKALLEGGTFLQPPLLQQLVDKLADFVVSCGLLRFKRFALPLLAFIRKCVGVGQGELEAMAAAAGIGPVLFEHWGEAAAAGHAEAAAAVPAAAGGGGGGGLMASNGTEAAGDQAAAAAAGGPLVPKLDLKQHHMAGSSSAAAAAAAAAAGDEVLPDLGEDGCGQPLSRRVRQLQGLQSWSASRQPPLQQQEQHEEREEEEQRSPQAGEGQAGIGDGQILES